MASTAISWALTLSLVGVGVYYYKPDLLSALSPSPTQPALSLTETSSKPISKKTKSGKKTQSSKIANSDVDSALSSSNEAQKSRKRKIVPQGENKATASSSGANTYAGVAAKSDADLGDKEFAQQLAKTQAGTDFKTSDRVKTKTKSKSQKQSRAQNYENPDVASPEFLGEDPETSDNVQSAAEPGSSIPADHARKAGDITDMLEAPEAKPTTLRLINIADEDSKKKKKPAAQPVEQVLTKKQRQARARKEEMRQMKEESDRLHEAKKQEQLRTARMAAGTSNQVKASNFGASSSSAWQSNSRQATVKAAPSQNVAPLLDTFDPSKGPVSQTHGSVQTADLSAGRIDDAATLKNTLGSQKASALTASTREAGSHKNLDIFNGSISEEDQMKLLKEEQAEHAWESVSSKKSKKKPKQDNDTGSETSSTVQSAPPIPQAQVEGAQTKKEQKRTEATTNRFGSFQVPVVNGLVDAEWEA